jgi:acyl dehydratase
MTALPASPVPLAAADRMPEFIFGPLSRTDFVRYAGAGGDFNPLHHDEPFAHAAGLASVFGMGLLHAGIMGMRVARWVGPANLRTYSVRFTARVWPGDTLTFTGEVTNLKGGTAHLLLSATRQDGEVVLKGAASAVAASGGA